MHYPETPSAKADPSANEVEFDKVSFTYAGAGASSLSDISFSVKKGQTVGIIGGTGCGKSTLVSLISRFYDVTCGTVKLNGRNVKRAYQSGNPRQGRNRTAPLRPFQRQASAIT